MNLGEAGGRRTFPLFSVFIEDSSAEQIPNDAIEPWSFLEDESVSLGLGRGENRLDEGRIAREDDISSKDIHARCVKKVSLCSQSKPGQR